MNPDCGTLDIEITINLKKHQHPRGLYVLEHDEERSLVAACGRQSVLSRFGMSRMVREVEDVYEALMLDRP
jgi:hypothetical protein